MRTSIARVTCVTHRRQETEVVLSLRFRWVLFRGPRGVSVTGDENPSPSLSTPSETLKRSYLY